MTVSSALSPAAARQAAGCFRTAVSLHSHTSQSLESLGFLSAFRDHFAVIPFVLRLASWQHRRATGDPFDIARVFWTPPLAPPDALAAETGQIESLGTRALVSLTDHDTMAGCLASAGNGGERRPPVSVEWTVPFGPTFFHLGIHNLPPAVAHAAWREMREYTRRPARRRLMDILAFLHGMSEVLVVFNHP